MRILELGCIDYLAAWEMQRRLAAEVAAGGEETVLLLEHPPTITLGRAAHAEHLLASSERLAALGVAVHEVDRGGDITYHGPGQLVGYPILDLSRRGRDLHAYLRMLEAALIDALAELGVESRRFPPHTGVWVGDEKIAAIGVKVSRWITTHGFALNVCPQMSHFDLIVPCGIRTHGVTSLAALLSRPVTLQEAGPPVRLAIQRAFEQAA